MLLVYMTRGGEYYVYNEIAWTDTQQCHIHITALLRAILYSDGYHLDTYHKRDPFTKTN